MKRPTIADIAQRAGVTKSSVSFALNGRPGVSEATRARIVAIAEELGWQPSSVARALSDGRAGAIGLVLDRPAHRSLGVEHFYMKLISGIEAELAAHGVALLLQVAEDRDAQMATYRRLWGERRVDGMFVLNLHVDDQRVPLLEELGMPVLVVGGPRGLGSLPGVWNDDAAAVRSVVEYLAALGHRRIAHVTGMPGLWHTVIRTEAFDAAAASAGVEAVTVGTDYTGEQGARATRGLLAGTGPPTAIFYDNDVLAVSGLSVAAEMRVPVPGRLSLVAWDDSVLCELVHPPLTAVSLDHAAYGGYAARRLLELVAGQPADGTCNATPVLVPRGSTAPPAEPEAGLTARPPRQSARTARTGLPR